MMIETLVLSTLMLIGSEPSGQQTVIAVVGAAGSEEYREQFVEWAGGWREAATQAGAGFLPIGLDDETEVSDRQRLQQSLKEQTNSAEPLWLVLIGHGTFDGRAAKFNTRGADVTAEELASWIEPINRPLAVINCASASGPFINKLSGPNRVLITGTKSGFQYNFARFGQHMSEAIADPAVDLDKDEQTSLLEAFLSASSKVQEFYAAEGRLATEHALLDDNGDGRGTPADWFRGVRAVRTAKDGASPDGLRANQLCLVRSEREANMPPEVRRRRDDLELQVARLRHLKSKMPEPEYYKRLEPLLIQLAELYQDLDGLEKPAEDQAQPTAAVDEGT